VASQRRTPKDTKEALLDAAEHLFARDGIHGARIREINALAGQRNPSALHYHFGSREGLVTAVMLRRQYDIEKVVERRLDDLEAKGQPSARDIIDAVIEPMLERLRTPSGRDWAKIVPQILGALSTNLRRGAAHPVPVTPQMERLLGLLQERMDHVPKAVQRERLVDYSIVLSSLVAERARQLDTGRRPALNEAKFRRHILDVLVAIVAAPSTVE
jgi:AcrR family transcriptional regulator